ncbi:hypothetical protein [Streptomyces sp. NPDC092903]|uniref:hypothetical protein n=1 Tax=Streptomyces sp. NPDC092903 TaxID=3366017 RepID=UPI00381894F1
MRPCNSADPNQLWVQKGQDQAGYGMVFAQDGRCITTTFSTAGKTYCDRLARTNTKRETWKQNSDGRVVNQATPSSMTHRAVRGSANAGQLYTRSSTGALFDFVPRPRRSALVTPITAG